MSNEQLIRDVEGRIAMYEQHRDVPHSPRFRERWSVAWETVLQELRRVHGLLSRGAA